MECGIYGCPARWASLLPQGARRLRSRAELRARKWDVLALTPDGRRNLLDKLRFRWNLRGNGAEFPGSGAALFGNGAEWRGNGGEFPRNGAELLESGAELSCGLLLLPGNCPAEWLTRIRADFAVSYGLSVRDTLTFSSLEEPTLCVQRALPTPDGGVIVPQEIPLPGLPAPVERYLPLLGLWLLCG